MKKAAASVLLPFITRNSSYALILKRKYSGISLCFIFGNPRKGTCKNHIFPPFSFPWGKNQYSVGMSLSSIWYWVRKFIRSWGERKSITPVNAPVCLCLKPATFSPVQMLARMTGVYTARSNGQGAAFFRNHIQIPPSSGWLSCALLSLSYRPRVEEVNGGGRGSKTKKPVCKSIQAFSGPSGET